MKSSMEKTKESAEGRFSHELKAAVASIYRACARAGLAKKQGNGITSFQGQVGAVTVSLTVSVMEGASCVSHAIEIDMARATPSGRKSNEGA